MTFQRLRDRNFKSRPKHFIVINQMLAGKSTHARTEMNIRPRTAFTLAESKQLYTGHLAEEATQCCLYRKRKMLAASGLHLLVSCRVAIVEGIQRSSSLQSLIELRRDDVWAQRHHNRTSVFLRILANKIEDAVGHVNTLYELHSPAQIHHVIDELQKMIHRAMDVLKKTRSFIKCTAPTDTSYKNWTVRVREEKESVVQFFYHELNFSSALKWLP